jgi:hypothetical protein
VWTFIGARIAQSRIAARDFDLAVHAVACRASRRLDFAGVRMPLDHNIDQRVAKIEATLQKLANVMVLMARQDERLIGSNDASIVSNKRPREGSPDGHGSF